MDKKKEKIIFLGTPEFSISSMEALLRKGFNIVAVITNPDEAVGRKQILTPPPVKVCAQKYNIQVFQPEKLTDELLASLPEADCFVVVAYGKIIPKSFLGVPKYGIINVHPSLLPRWRGPSPMQYTILHGDEKAGVTIMKIDEQMDHGPILAQQEWESPKPKAQSPKLTYKKLHDELAKMGAELLIETLPKWFAGEIEPKAQDDAKATFSKLLRKDDGRINWSRPAEEIERLVRALNPWPGTWSHWPHDSKIFRIRIEEADWTEKEPPQGSPGFIWNDDSGQILVKTGQGSLVVKETLLEGKTSLSAKDFILGHPQFIGSCLV